MGTAQLSLTELTRQKPEFGEASVVMIYEPEYQKRRSYRNREIWECQKSKGDPLDLWLMTSVHTCSLRPGKETPKENGYIVPGTHTALRKALWS